MIPLPLFQAFAFSRVAKPSLAFVASGVCQREDIWITFVAYCLYTRTVYEATRTQSICMPSTWVNACCQEIFKVCPRMLADVIVNNDLAYLEPGRQLPEAREVKRLYKDFWGRTGPPNPIIPGSRASELSLCEYFLVLHDLINQHFFQLFLRNCFESCNIFDRLRYLSQLHSFICVYYTSRYCVSFVQTNCNVILFYITVA